MSAIGIHDHPTRKLGRAPGDPDKPALMLAEFLTGEIPTIPAAADFEGELAFPMNANDRIGDCFPVSVANHIIATSAFCGVPYTVAEADVVALYSAISGYDPRTGAHDDGCVMQDGLGVLLRQGVRVTAGGVKTVVKPVAFAKIGASDVQTLDQAVALFGGTLWGVDLQTSQQAQTDATPPVWDYRRSGDWGGHAIYSGRYGGGGRIGVVSWEELIDTTVSFRANQLEEVWLPIWPWHLDHPGFLAGVDVHAFAEAYHRLTGRTLPLPTPPQPAPVPTPTPVNPPPSPVNPPPSPSPSPTDPPLDKLLARLRRDAAHGVGAHLSANEVEIAIRGLTQS